MARALPRRGDYSDSLAYARAMYEHTPMSASGVGPFLGLPGFRGRVLDATWGTRAEYDAEIDALQRSYALRRPAIFAEKLRTRRSTKAWSEDFDPLGERDVAAALSAAEFARDCGWLMDTSLTLSVGMIADDGSQEFIVRRLLKCLADVCRQLALPRAYLAVVENAPSVGLHLHAAIHIPLNHRDRVRDWFEKFVRDECRRRGVAYQPNMWAMSRHRQIRPVLHDVLTHYLLKGYDPQAVVQSAAQSPDGLPVMLGDLLAFNFADPGVIPFARLYVGSSINARARGAWASSWEQGERDVNELYSRDFVEYVRRRYPVPTLTHTDINGVRCVLPELDELYRAVQARGDQASPAVLGWQVVVERDLELAARALSHVCAYFALYRAIDARGRYRLRAAMHQTVEAAHAAIVENGEEVVELMRDHQLPLAERTARVLATCESAMRALCAKLGLRVRCPTWAINADLQPSLPHKQTGAVTPEQAQQSAGF